MPDLVARNISLPKTTLYILWNFNSGVGLGLDWVGGASGTGGTGSPREDASDWGGGIGVGRGCCNSRAFVVGIRVRFDEFSD